MFGQGDAPTQLILRGATAPATTGAASWAGVLSQQVVEDFVASITALSAAASLVGRGMRLDLTGLASIRIPQRTFDKNAAGSWIAEGQPIPVRNLSVSAG